MKQIRLGRFTVLAVLAGVSLAGCCEKEKKSITALNAQNLALRDKNLALQKQVSDARIQQGDHLDQLDAKDAELLAANQRLMALEAQGKKPEGADKTPKGGWDIGASADRVSLTSDILFPPGKATLSSGGRAALNQIVATLSANYRGMPVRVYGFTDSDPIRRTKTLWRDNLDLSSNRAMAVTRYLRLKNIPASNIETIGMGMTRPATKNSSRQGKARNRRVEIVVIKN